MSDYVSVGDLSVSQVLHRFVEDEALPASGVASADFWAGVQQAVAELGPRQRALLDRREELQTAIDAYHRNAPGPVSDLQGYQGFLRGIGYLVDEPEQFSVSTTGVDVEISDQCGPQLVVPILNARFAANAANARWGSLYDAFYGSDVIDQSGELAPGRQYNPLRGEQVITRARAFLDQVAPLTNATHRQVIGYSIDEEGLLCRTADGQVRLAEPGQIVGYRGEPQAPDAIVLVHHQLHVEITIDRADQVGGTDPAGVKDIVLEAALTSIMDLEDSVAAVDATDKVAGYRNWLLLMQGRLTAEVSKNGRTFTRGLNADRSYTTLRGQSVTLPGRALMFVRQVGHLMTTDAVLDATGAPVAEGIVDAFVTGLGSCHDIRGNTARPNSRTGAMYVVKPKQHGPDEVALTVDLFGLVEDTLGLARNTIKVGIMDEERRTTLNLAACIHAARERIAFINTGFLDRTGDEIHTAMLAGPVVRKNDMKRASWLAAYEDANVDVGLACGLMGRAQIGKGMWAAPDNLAAMLKDKIAQPRAGANTAWVPSPTAATLHALHYHAVDVKQRQRELLAAGRRGTLNDLLVLPLADPRSWSEDERRAELDNNVQATLGYVVRWIDAGVGCSKVPDLAGTPLMEDRATCRISSQHVSNWLHHGVITAEQVHESLRRMAVLVDEQNSDDPDYRPMAPSFDGEAFLAASELLLDGAAQPSGYTEPILHRHRLAAKAR
ncbi:malate synthase G [Jatrophihabitans telluris]|uniref:malate synthase G n=1 Tax=Jatrophihabitans telluris TaxID=2038343 RepID=UPI003222024A